MVKYLILALPVAVHILIKSEQFTLALVLLYCTLLAALRATRTRSKAVFALQAIIVAAFAALGLMVLQENRFAVYLPSVVIPLLYCGVFTGSLLPGKTPLITRFARKEHGERYPRLERYTRWLTMVWAGFLLLLALEALTLAFWASMEIWSLFTNVLNYLFIFAFFVLEYTIRIRMMREIRFSPFFQFIRSLPQGGVLQRRR